MQKCKRMGSVLEWRANFDEEQNAGLYDFVNHGSGIGSGNGMRTRYAVFNAAAGVHWTEGAKADGVDGG